MPQHTAHCYVRFERLVFIIKFGVRQGNCMWNMTRLAVGWISAGMPGGQQALYQRVPSRITGRLDNLWQIAAQVAALTRNAKIALLARYANGAGNGETLCLPLM